MPEEIAMVVGWGIFFGMAAFALIVEYIYRRKRNAQLKSPEGDDTPAPGDTLA